MDKSSKDESQLKSSLVFGSWFDSAVYYGLSLGFCDSSGPNLEQSLRLSQDLPDEITSKFFRSFTLRNSVKSILVNIFLFRFLLTSMRFFSIVLLR